MFQVYRFEAADDVFDGIAQQYLDVPACVGVILSTAPDDADVNPAGPQIIAYYSDLTGVNEARTAQDVPLTVRTPYDEIEILVREGVSRAQAAHEGDDSPMRPGSSVGSAQKTNAGTLGAVVDAPGNGDHFITAGHVARGDGDGVGERFVQAGGLDANRAGREPRVVGTVVANSYAEKLHDGALVKLDPTFTITRLPYDGVTAISPATPAVGMLRGTLNGFPFFMHINDTCGRLGARIVDITRMSRADIGKEVMASGCTSGLIKGEIFEVAWFNDNGIRTKGFKLKPAGTTQDGDSGAVAVLPRDVSSQIIERDNLIDVQVVDRDTPAEYLPGVSDALDELIGSDGAGVSSDVENVTINRRQGRDIVTRILSALSGIGNLTIKARSRGYRHGCAPSDRKSLRPTPVKEVVLQKGKLAEIPDVAFDEIEISPESGTCCTFGTAPYVVIQAENGDGVEQRRPKINIKGIGTLTVRVSVSQTITGARFDRYGQCFKNICDREFMRGVVFAQREYEVDFSLSAGSIKLPGIGKIVAGEAEIEIKTTVNIEKNFEVFCSA